MSKIIEEIVQRLKQYPDTNYETTEGSITINPKDDHGFPVTMIDNGDAGFTVAFDFWHEEFADYKDALSCFAFGLSTDCRLKLTKKGNRIIRWTVESNENDSWEESSTTGLFTLLFWKKSEHKILQNNLLDTSNGALE
jgi:hypothetical protein